MSDTSGKDQGGDAQHGPQLLLFVCPHCERDIEISEA
jgi:hypothetical protein